MPTKSLIDLAVAVVLMASLIGIGWAVRGWKEDADRLETERALAKAYTDRVEQIGAQEQATLMALQQAREDAGKNQKEIVREVTRYRDRPCLDDGAVRLLQEAARGRAAPGPDGAVPRDAAASP